MHFGSWVHFGLVSTPPPPHKILVTGLPGGGDSKEVTGMLVVSLRVLNCRFWSHLGCQGLGPFRHLLGLYIKKFTNLFYRDF